MPPETIVLPSTTCSGRQETFYEDGLSLSLGPLCLRDVRVERIVYLYGCIITVTIYIIQPFEIFRLGLGWSIVGRGGHPCTEQDCIRDQRRGYKGGQSHSLIAMLPKFLFLLLGSPQRVSCQDSVRYR